MSAVFAPAFQPGKDGIQVLERWLVRRAWSRVEVAEQRIIQVVILHLLHAAAREIEIAEGDGPNRTRGLAGSLDLAVHKRPALRSVPACHDLRFADTLHAIGGFLHHAAAADRG